MDKSTDTDDLAKWVGIKPSNLTDKATDTNDLPAPLSLGPTESHVGAKPHSNNTIRVSNLTLISCAVLFLALLLYIVFTPAGFLTKHSADLKKNLKDQISNKNAINQKQFDTGRDEFKYSSTGINSDERVDEVALKNEKEDAVDDAQSMTELDDEDIDENGQTRFSNEAYDNENAVSKDNKDSEINDDSTNKPKRNQKTISQSQEVDGKHEDKQDNRAFDTNTTTHSSEQIVIDNTHETANVEITRESSPKWMPRYKWKLLNKIDVKTSTDTIYDYSWITGLVALHGNILIVADYNNNKLKLVNTKMGDIIVDLKLQETPWSMTKINESTIAVTCTGKIVFYEVTDTISEKRTLSVGGYATGISYYKEQLFVTFENPAKLQVFDMFGHVLTDVQPLYRGYPLFGKPRYVKVHPERGTIFVSDDMNRTLTELNLDGTVRRVNADSKLSHLGGVEIGPLGDIWVCEWTSASATILSFDPESYHFTAMLLTRPDLLENPYTLFYCNESRRLYIGAWKGSVINVYEMTDISNKSDGQAKAGNT